MSEMINAIDKQWSELTYEQFQAQVFARTVLAKRGRDDLHAYFKSEGINKANVGGNLFAVVCRLLNPMSLDLREKLRQFERLAIWDAVSKSESVYPIGAVIEILLDAKRPGLNGETTSIDTQFESSLAGAIAAAVDRVVIEGPYVDEELYKQMKFRDFDECRAAVELQGKGYQVEMDQGGRLVLTTESGNRLFKCLDVLMAKISGRKALNLLWHGAERFPKLLPLLSYKRQHSRWPLCRIWSDDCELKNQFEQLFPYNFWLNLAVKHFNSSTTANDEDIDECIDLILAYSRFANVIPSQMATTYKMMNPKEFIPTLQKIAQYSHLYKIDQMRMKDAVDIIEMCSANYASAKVNGSLKLAQVVCVLKVLTRLFDGKCGPTMFSITDICRIVGGLRPEVVRQSLDLFVAKGGVPNKDYTDPNNPKGYVLYRKPIIRCGDSFFVVDPSMAAAGFLSEFVFSGLFGLEKNDKKIGPLIEDVIKRRLADKGLNPKTGFFSVQGGNVDAYEADAIMTDADSIVAVEIKKKSIKEESRCGDSLQLMRDLAAGLLDDVKQARRYLGELAKYHTLELHQNRNDKDPIHTLYYRGDEKMTIVAMPLFDFDAFQTPAFTRSFFHKCGDSIDVRFTGEGPVPTQADRDSCVRLNKSLAEYQKIAKDYPEVLNIPIAVISIPQMMCLLDEVKNATDFHKLVSSLPLIDFGAFDFYLALDRQLQLQKSPPN